ncbi:MAG TPA: tetratricopeptide repeat protein [Steroidobacteraceae bacterium]
MTTERVAQLRERANKSLEAFGPAAETAELFKELVRLEPGDALAWFNWGDSLRSIGRFQDAKEALLTARELMPKSRLFAVDTRLGMVFSECGPPAEAEKWFRLATSNSECHGWVWLLRADNLMRMESFKLARECLKTARVRGNVDLEEVLLNEALIDRCVGDYEDAAHRAKQALEIDPGYDSAKELLASLRGATEARQYVNGLGDDAESRN